VRVRLIVLALLVTATFQVGAALSAAPSRHQSGSFGIQLLGAPGQTPGGPLSRVYIVDRLAPGTTINRRVEISNSTRSIAHVAVYPAAASFRHGRFGFAAGRRPNELSSWTSVSQGALRLPAGDKAFETVTIKVPEHASSGERHAVVWAEMSASAGRAGGVTLVNRVGIRIYLSVGQGGAGLASFTVGSLHGERSASGRPFIATSVTNGGQQTLTIGGSLTLSNGPGGLRLPAIPVELGAALARNASEQAKVPLDKQLPRGPWHVRLRLSSGLIQRTADASIVFPRPAPAATPAAASNFSVYIVVGILSVLISVVTTLLFFRRAASWRRP
jgi:hypothetical protein